MLHIAKLYLLEIFTGCYTKMTIKVQLHFQLTTPHFLWLPTSMQPIYSLVDRGANVRLCDTNVCIIEKTERSIDIQGVYNHKITDVLIVTADDFVNT